MNDQQLFAAVRALPHMTITKSEGEYRVAPHLGSIRAAWPHWYLKQHKEYAERVSYYTQDRDDALGTAKVLSEKIASLFAA